jgi:hypothetical protein
VTMHGGEGGGLQAGKDRTEGKEVIVPGASLRCQLSREAILDSCVPKHALPQSHAASLS